MSEQATHAEQPLLAGRPGSVTCQQITGCGLLCGVRAVLAIDKERAFGIPVCMRHAVEAVKAGYQLRRLTRFAGRKSPNAPASATTEDQR